MKIPLKMIARFVLLSVVVFLLISLRAVPSHAEPATDEYVFLPLVCKTFALPGTGYGDITGTVFDARTNNKLDSVQVCVSATGQCDTTDGFGNYSISDVPNGNHLLNFTRDTYIDSGMQITVLPDTAVTANAFLYPVLEGDQYRVVLTWDTNRSWYCTPEICPNDLNLHLWIMDGNTFDLLHHITFGNPGECNDIHESEPHACYENNEEYGSGPDVLVFRGLPERVYHIAVLNYYEGRPNVPGLKDLDTRGTPAHIAIYRGSETTPVLEKTITTTTAGNGDLWYVAKVDVDIFPQDCLSSYMGDTPPDECLGP